MPYGTSPNWTSYSRGILSRYDGDMNARCLLLAVGCLTFVLPAAAQIDSDALRAKFGIPLAQETFRIPSGIDVVADYGPHGQACQLEFVATGASDKQVDELVADLVPLSMRGKKLGEIVIFMGLPSVTSVNYEHVAISEPGETGRPGRRTGPVVVAFKNDACQKQQSGAIKVKAPDGK